MSEVKTSTPFDAGIELYHMAKPEGDPDLVQQVRGILSSAGVTEDGLSRNYDGHRFIQAGVGKTSPVQRANLVRFTSLTLMRSAVPATSLMADLPVSGSLEPWVKHMESKVAPFIAKHKLLEK